MLGFCCALGLLSRASPPRSQRIWGAGAQNNLRVFWQVFNGLYQVRYTLLPGNAANKQHVRLRLIHAKSIESGQYSASAGIPADRCRCKSRECERDQLTDRPRTMSSRVPSDTAITASASRMAVLLDPELIA